MDTQRSPEPLCGDPKMRLFLRQKNLLDTFLAHHAITKEQYDKSYGDLKVKMGIEDNGEAP